MLKSNCGCGFAYTIIVNQVRFSLVTREGIVLRKPQGRGDKCGGGQTESNVQLIIKC